MFSAAMSVIAWFYVIYNLDGLDNVDISIINGLNSFYHKIAIEAKSI